MVMSKNKWFIIGAALVIVVLTAVVTFFIVKDNAVPQVTKEVEKYEVTRELNTFLTQNDTPPSSMMISPATQKWWDYHAEYNQFFVKVAHLNFKDFSEGAKYVATTVSMGEGYENSASVGLNSMFIMYENNEAAAEAHAKIPESIPRLLHKNMILFAAQGNIVDLNYTYDEFDDSKTFLDDEDIIVDDKSVWLFSFKEFMQSQQVGTNDSEKERMKDVLKALLNTDSNTFDFQWVATSADGLKWDGQLYNFDSSKLNNLGQEYLNNFITTLDGTRTWTDSNGESYTYKKTGEPTMNDDVADRQLNQSNLRYNMSIQTPNVVLDWNYQNTPPDVRKEEGMKEIKPLPQGDGIYRLNIPSLNGFLGMLSHDASSYPSYYMYESATFTLLDTDGKFTLEFTPIVFNTDDAEHEDVKAAGERLHEEYEVQKSAAEAENEALAAEVAALEEEERAAADAQVAEEIAQADAENENTEPVS